MKKTLLLITSIITLFLVGCGSSSDKVMKCSLDTNLEGYSLKTEYEVHHDGKYVKSIKTVETVTASSASLIDQMETYMKSMYETLSSTYGGYDYKVSKTEPMNVASIIAIVGGAILFIAVVVIIVRLRKKIAVK